GEDQVVAVPRFQPALVLVAHEQVVHDDAGALVDKVRNGGVDGGGAIRVDDLVAQVDQAAVTSDGDLRDPDAALRQQTGRGDERRLYDGPPGTGGTGGGGAAGPAHER